MHSPEDREAAYEEIARRMNRIAQNGNPATWRFDFGSIAGLVHQEWPVFDYQEIDGWFARWRAELPNSVLSP